MTTTLVHRYEPRGAAKRLLSCRDGEILLSGPAGTGKSRACLEKLNAVALKYPKMRGLILRKTQRSLATSALDTWRKTVVPEALSAGLVRWYGGSAAEPAQYRYSNGSTVVVGGMDLASKIMSTEYDMVYVQEATELTVTDWESAITRLRNGVMPYQQLIADTNPAHPGHWLKQRADEGRTVLMESRHEDNPVYVNADGTLTVAGRTYIGRLDSLTGVRFQRLRRGLWVAAEGQIWENWDPAVHLVDRLPAGSEAWTRYWSIDFGYVNPFVLQCWAEDPDGRLWLCRELYFTGRLVEDHAHKILGIVAPLGHWKEPRPRAIITDHDAEDRATLERALGMTTTAATKTVTDGLQAVENRLRVAGDGKPRLFILRDALVERDRTLAEAGKPTCTADEIPGYTWATTKDGRPAKEEPNKVDDHGCDALRYMVAHLDLLGTPRVRVLGRRRTT